jgi:hypothetical protein
MVQCGLSRCKAHARLLDDVLPRRRERGRVTTAAKLQPDLAALGHACIQSAVTPE